MANHSSFIDLPIKHGEFFIFLVGGFNPSEKYHQLALLIPIYGKTTNVPNHQPVMLVYQRVYIHWNPQPMQLGDFSKHRPRHLRRPLHPQGAATGARCSASTFRAWHRKNGQKSMDFREDLKKTQRKKHYFYPHSILWRRSRLCLTTLSCANYEWCLEQKWYC